MSRLVLALAVLAGAVGCSGSVHAPAAPSDAGFGDTASLDAPGPGEASVDARAPELDATVAPERRVLFIGNSYTYVNELPTMLAQLSATSGVAPRLRTESVTVGGAALVDHWNTGTATARIDEKGWYAVVLQGQSVEPLLPGSNFAAFAQKFAERATENSARPVFYATWARAAGDAVFAETWSGGTPDLMQDKLTGAYSAAATAGKGGLAKVGEAFRLSLKERPALVLHQSDRSHPSLAGTYLAACVFYGVLVERALPSTATIPAGVSGDDATFLRGVAVRVTS